MLSGSELKHTKPGMTQSFQNVALFQGFSLSKYTLKGVCVWGKVRGGIYSIALFPYTSITILSGEDIPKPVGYTCMRFLDE